MRARGGDDDLICVRVEHQIGVMSDNDYLALDDRSYDWRCCLDDLLLGVTLQIPDTVTRSIKRTGYQICEQRLLGDIRPA